jgi:hypothetical protein
MFKKLSLVTLFLLIPFMLSYAQFISLKDYKAKNPDEEAIVEVLQSLSEGWRKKDKQQILSFYHKNAQFVDWNGKYISKEQMIGTEVKDWGPPSKVWYGYYDVKIEIDGDKAAVNLTEMRSYGPYMVNMQMVRENEKWLILQHEWRP